MMIRLASSLFVFAVLVACAAPSPAVVPDARPAPAESEIATAATPLAVAQEAAEAWLAHVDADRYEASWEAAAEPLRQQVSQTQWEQAGRQVRQQVGAIRGRTLEDARHTTDIPQAPPGEYVVLIYRTSFERGSATEQLIMMLEDDGAWRAVGYFVRP